MARHKRPRALLLASIAALARLLAGGSERVLCVARGDHVALEPAHTASVCPALARYGGSDSVQSPARDCVDLSLDGAGGASSLAAPSDSKLRTGLFERALLSAATLVDVRVVRSASAPRLLAEPAWPVRPGVGTVVLLI